MSFTILKFYNSLETTSLRTEIPWNKLLVVTSSLLFCSPQMTFHDENSTAKLFFWHQQPHCEEKMTIFVYPKHISVIICLNCLGNINKYNTTWWYVTRGNLTGTLMQKVWVRTLIHSGVIFSYL